MKHKIMVANMAVKVPYLNHKAASKSSIIGATAKIIFFIKLSSISTIFQI